MKADAVLCVFGWLLGGLSLSMLIPALGALIADDIEHARVFFNSAAVSGFFAGAMIISLRGKEIDLNKRGSLLLIVLIWTILPVFAAVPIYFSGVIFSPGKALFEAVSGFTTSGATVLTHLDRQPAAILLWRAILQWLGGLYTIIAASGIFVVLGIGGLQLQYAGMPHGDGQTLFGRLQQVARALLGIYSALTLLCFLGLWAAGMPIFDAFCHALSTVSTGGFSTRDASIGAFNSPRIEAVAAIFMILGAMNMALHWAAANGRWRGYRLDPEARYLGVAILVTVASVFLALYASDFDGGVRAAHWALFNGASFLTTTGYWTGNIAGAPLVVGLILIAAVLVGGATGSTSGGFKEMRVGLVVKQGWLELARLISPNEVLGLRYGKVRVKEAQIAAVWAVFIGFSFFLAMGTILISLTGPNFEQSFAIAAAAMSNSGPAAGLFFADPITPYASVSEATRGLAMVGMIVGRMEVLTLLTLLSPAFWRG
ncbi:MAG: potassium transporter TrkG [Alphaproteobacteria bacterium]|nr:potassium transporter TrkG [Alphaproteobacteria bacterium]